MFSKSLSIILITIGTSALMFSSALANDTYRPVQRVGRSLSTATGPSVRGFAVSLSAPSSTVHLGKPIAVVLELRNISGADQHAILGKYEFSIINSATGGVVPKRAYPRYFASFSGSSRGLAISSGNSKFVETRLDDNYAIDQPGTYRISVMKAYVGVPPDSVLITGSNTIVITILP